MGQMAGKGPKVGELGRDGVGGALFGEEELLLESVQKPLDLVGGSSDHGGRLLGGKGEFEVSYSPTILYAVVLLPKVVPEVMLKQGPVDLPCSPTKTLGLG